MNNPIPKYNLFATPASFEELSEMIESIGSSEEKRMAWFGAMIALNLAHDLIQNQTELLVARQQTVV
jgi:hypothetical protein